MIERAYSLWFIYDGKSYAARVSVDIAGQSQKNITTLDTHVVSLNGKTYPVSPSIKSVADLGQYLQANIQNKFPGTIVNIQMHY